MAYTINKTDGTILASVPDGQINQLSADITLIGKNYSGFGEILNENFVKILENFADTKRPNRPVRGQTWYDTSVSKLKVYTGTQFVPVGSAHLAKTQPQNLGVGDLWFNETDRQLYFYDGITSLMIGPVFSKSQGQSGILVDTVDDKNGIKRVITLLYNNEVLLGIFSKDEFTPRVPIVGYSAPGVDRVIKPGFNVGFQSNLKFDVTSTNSEKLDGVESKFFARRDQPNIFSDQISVISNDGITVGDGFQATIQVDLGNVVFSNNASNRNLELKVRKNNTSEAAVVVKSTTREINFYSDFSDSVSKFGGSVEIAGDLVVNGNTTTVNTSILAVKDKNIELAQSSSPTDAQASGGGITLKGTSDHSLTWTSDTRAWNSTEHFNLVSSESVTAPEFKINGVTVLSSNSLGPGITSIPGVTRFGTQTEVTVGPFDTDANQPIAHLKIENNRISTLQFRQDLEIAPQGNLKLIGSPTLVGLTTTNESLPLQAVESSWVLDEQELSEATTKKYVTNFVRTRPLVLTLDISDGISEAEIAGWLTSVAPPDEFDNGTVARILCSDVRYNSAVLNLDSLVTTVSNVEYVTPTGTGFPVSNVSIAPATLPVPQATITRSVKTFRLELSQWILVNS